MSVHTKQCLRCGAPLVRAADHLSVDCPKCGAHFRLHQHHAKPAPAAEPPQPRVGILIRESPIEPVAAPNLPPMAKPVAAAPPRRHRGIAGLVGLMIALALAFGLGLLVPVISHFAGSGDGNPAVAEHSPKENPDPPKAKSLLTTKRSVPKGKSGNEPTDLTSIADLRAKLKGETKVVPPPPTDVRDIFRSPVSTTADAADSSANRIDDIVFAQLREKNITPAALCSDGVFIRRVYLDVIGTLPTADEAKTFLKDPDPKKREALIDHLLRRSEFADYWAMRWSDILRLKSEFPINLWPNAARAYQHWIKTALRDNMPYDQFARALLTSSGSNFRNPPANFYRAMQKKDAPTAARTVALTFMGIRPEGLPAERWTEMEVFFSQVGYKATREWKEEIVYFDERKTLRSSDVVFPDETAAKIPPGQDPRVVFADWLTSPKIPGSRRTSRIGFGRGCSVAASSTNRTTSALTIHRSIRNCSPISRTTFGRPTTT